MSNYIYAVVGVAGEYSDKREWYVCAYFDKDKAVKHADNATLWCYENRKKIEDIRYTYDHDGYGNPYDPQMLSGYTGTDYYTVAIEIREELPNG